MRIRIALMSLLALFALVLVSPARADVSPEPDSYKQCDCPHAKAGADKCKDCPHHKAGKCDCPHAKKGAKCDCAKHKDCPHAKKGQPCNCPSCQKRKK